MLRACELFQKKHKTSFPVFAVAGGVAANQAVRNALQSVAKNAGFQFNAAPLKFCTDNAAMIAWAGIELTNDKRTDVGDLVARPRWPLDQTASPMLGSGKKGAKA